MSELFPEVDGLEEEAAAAGPTRRARPADLFSIQRRLGLPGPFAGSRVVRAAVEGGLLRVQVEGPRTGKIGLVFGPGGESAVDCGPGLSLRYSGTQLTQPLRLLLRYVGERVKGATYEQLDRLIEAPARTAHSPPDNETSFGFSYASDVAWHTFFEGQESYRGYCGAFSGRIASVHHADNECVASGHDVHNGTMNFFNFMRMERPALSRDMIYLETDLEDLDVIKGGDRKLDEVLGLLEGKRESLDAVLVMSTCISLVTGDDMEGAAAKLESKLRLPVISIGNAINPQADLFKMLRQRPGFLREAEREGHFNLVGYPRLGGYDELLSLLADGGARVRAWLLPSLDVEDLRTCHGASAQVLYPCAWQAQGYKPMIEGMNIPTIQPLPPFGVEGSRRWMQAIADALGRREAVDAVLAERLERLAEGWEELRAEARETTLGLVVNHDALNRLREPEHLLGVPLVPLLREMGFQLEFLRYAPAWEEAKPSTQEGGAVRVVPFSSPRQLEELLRASKAGAFYSDVSFDRRLTRTGKNIFSLRDLEVGPAGAVRSLRRLLKASRLPFFRKYGSYLGRPWSPRLEREP